jgi:hypothetical protein
VLVVLVLAGWAYTGPLQAGWARRAGTPDDLLASPATDAATGASDGTAPGAPAAAPGSLPVPFDASFAGTISETATGDRVTVTIQGSLSGAASGTASFTLQGTPVGDGVRMSSGTAALGPTAQPDLYDGTVSTLSGAEITARLRDAAGDAVTETARLDIAADGRSFTGTLTTTQDG